MQTVDTEDDWLFESIRKYNGLYMYNLQKAVQAAEWLGSDGLVVSVSDDRRHELLELSLPAQISVDDDSNGLSKDRDFTVMTGGFSDGCLVSLKLLKNSRRVAAALRGDNSVETWQLQTGEQNLIEKVGVIQNKVSSCVSSETCILDKDQVVFGSHLTSLCLADLSSQTMLSSIGGVETASRVSNMIRHDSVVMTSDRTTGQLYVIDTPVPDLQSVTHDHDDTLVSQQDGDVTWTLCEPVTSSDKSVIQMCSSGIVCVRDSRNFRHKVKSVKTDLPMGGDTVKISACPTNPDLLAVTGFGGHVYVYDSATWEDGAKVTPVFVHKGHMAERTDDQVHIVTNTHLWYPWKPKTILSASCDGGLHLFQPVL